jgi:hypothetical protein
MWTAMERKKNIYLMTTLKSVEPKILNKSMRLCFDRTKSSVLLEDPCTVDDKKINNPYGREGIKKLVNLLLSENELEQDAVLDALLNKLQGSMHCYEAIQLNIVTKLCKLFVTSETENSLIDKIFRLLALVATTEVGATQIAENIKIMTNIFQLLSQDGSHTLSAWKLLRELARYTAILDKFIADGFLALIKSHVAAIEENKNDLLKFLALLIERQPQAAIDEKYFDVIFSKLKSTKPTEMEMWLECFAYLLNSTDCQKLANANHVIHFIYQHLQNTVLSEESIKYAVLCLQNCTIGSKAKHYCSQLWNFPLILIEYAHSKSNEYLQLYAINTLKHLAECPRTRKFMNKCCRRQIERICCLNSYNVGAKQAFLKLLRTEYPYMYEN